MKVNEGGNNTKLNRAERISMEAHFSGPDRSLNATVGQDETDELQDFLVDKEPTPEENTARMHDHRTRAEWLRQALGELSPREREVISRQRR